MNKLIVLALLQTGLLYSLEINTAIQLALENNLELQVERLSLSKEEINLNKAKKSEFYPEIEAKITSGETKKIAWEKNEEGIEERVVTRTREKPTLEIDSMISRPHPLGGKLKINLKTTTILENNQDTWEVKLESEEPLSSYQRRNIKDPIKDERLSLSLAKLNLKERINEIIYQVIESFCELQNLGLSLKIKEKELKDLNDNLEISKLKAEKGIIPEMDIIQIELQISSVFNEIESLKKEKRTKLARFSKQIGTKTEDMQAKESLKDEIEKIKNYPFDLEDLNRLSQIQRKQIEIEQAKRSLSWASSKNLPVFIPSYSVSGAKKEREEKLGFSVSFALYDKGIKKEEIRLAEASLSQIEIELKDLVSSIKIDIAENLDSINNRQMRLKTLEKDISLSEKLYEIAKIKYARGLISAKDLLEYQRDLFGKKANLFSENIELFLDYIKQFKIKGELYNAYKKDIF